jgi:hypothetical protein
LGSGGQPTLWSLGISGDLPIILVRISDIHQVDVVRDALQAVEYWRMKQLAVKECPFDPPPPPAYRKGATWVRPELQALVEITEFTNDGLVRHASFLELVSE